MLTDIVPSVSFHMLVKPDEIVFSFRVEPKSLLNLNQCIHVHVASTKGSCDSLDFSNIVRTNLR